MGKWLIERHSQFVSILLLVSLSYPSDSLADKNAVNGIVVDSNGKPVVGADVYLIDMYNADWPNKHAKSDLDGKFQLNRKGARRAQIIVSKPGYGLAFYNGFRIEQSPQTKTRKIDTRTSKPTGPVTVQISKGLNVKAEFAYQDGRPIELEFAKVRYCSNSKHYFAVAPIEVFGTVKKSTLNVDFYPSEDSVINFDVKTKNGEEFQLLLQAGFGTGTVVLGSDSSISGIVQDTNGVPVGNVEVVINNRQVKTKTNTKVMDYSIARSHRTKTDGSGKFAIRNIASGTNSFQLDSDQYFLAEDNRNQTSLKLDENRTIPGEILEVNLKARSTCEVKGRIVDQDGNGIAGVKLYVSSRNYGNIVTDEEGNFSFRSTRSPATCRYTDLPDGYLGGINTHFTVEVKPGQKSAKFDEIILESASPVIGSVVDSKGQPVTNALVKAIWTKTDGKYFTVGSDSTYSGEDGKFELSNTSGKFKVGLSAESGEMASPTVEMLNLDDDRRDVRLVTRKDGLVPLKGIVNDSASNPIANAKITLKQAISVPGGNLFGERQVFGDLDCRTDENGQFEFPVRLARIAQFSVAVSMDGYTSYESPMLKLKPGESEFRFSGIRLVKTRSAIGRVVGSDGKPISNAKVTGFKVQLRDSQNSSEAESTTDENGEFELSGLHPNCRILFVEKPGFRYRGFELSDSTGGNIPEFVIETEKEEYSEPPLRLFTRDEKKLQKLAHQHIANRISWEKGRGAHEFRLLAQLASGCDSALRQQILNSAPGGRTRSSLLFGFGEIDDAMEVVASLTTARSRSSAYQAGAEIVHDKQISIELLQEAGAQAASIQESGSRIESYGGIIEALHERGDIGSARALAEIALPLGLNHGYEGRGNFARGWLARAVVEMFPQEAVQLIGDIEDQNSFDRHHGNLAHEMAAIDPKFAESLFSKINRPEFWVQRVIYRMGTVDEDRAFKLLEQTNFKSDWRKWNAPAVLAYSIRETNPERSRELLATTVNRMLNEQDHRYTLGAAINLLRFSVEIDPDKANDYFWKLLRLYSNPNSDAWGANEAKSRGQIRIGRQAMLLALFDKLPKVQRAILQPIMDDFKNLSDKNDRWFNEMTDRGHIFVAMAIRMPEATLEWCDWYYRNVPPDKTRYLPQPWEVIGWSLVKSNVELANYCVQELSHAWAIDNEDY